MSLTSTPNPVVKLAKGDTRCAADHPYYQQLDLKELNGYDVNLTGFVAGGYDYSGQLAAWFGSTRLPASGKLSARMCWPVQQASTTFNYQVKGTDNTGQSLQATLSVKFVVDPLDQKSGSLSVGSIPGSSPGDLFPGPVSTQGLKRGIASGAN